MWVTVVALVSLVTFDACDNADRGRSKLALFGRSFPAKCALGDPDTACGLADTGSRENESSLLRFGLLLLLPNVVFMLRNSGERSKGDNKEEEVVRMRRGHTDAAAALASTRGDSLRMDIVRCRIIWYLCKVLQKYSAGKCYKNTVREEECVLVQHALQVLQPHAVAALDPGAAFDGGVCV